MGFIKFLKKWLYLISRHYLGNTRNCLSVAVTPTDSNKKEKNV